MTWTRGPRHAPLLEVRALLRLLPTEQGGRHSPVRSRYHPDWDLGNTWTGEPTIHGGQVVLLGVDEVGPGEACDVVIEPLAAEFWCEVRVGSVIVAREGRRVVGHATVLAVASPVAGFTCLVVGGRNSVKSWLRYPMDTVRRCSATSLMCV